MSQREGVIKVFVLTPQAILDNLGNETSATFTRLHHLIGTLTSFPDMQVRGVSSPLSNLRFLLKRPLVLAPYPSCLNSPIRRLLFSLSRLVGCKIVIEIQDTRLQSSAVLGKESMISVGLEGKTLRAGTAYVCTSPFMWNSLKEEYGLRGPIIIISPGVEDSFLTTYPKQYRAVPGRFNIAYLGGISQNRGIEILLQAVQLLRSSHPETTLHLIGPITKEFLEENLSTLEQDFIRNYTVAHNNVPEVLEPMDVQVVLYNPEDPYMGQVSPAKVFEYLGTTKPIISSKSLPIIDLGIDGLVFVDYDRDSIHEALEELSDPLVRERISEKLMEQREGNTWLKRGKALHSFLISLSDQEKADQ